MVLPICTEAILRLTLTVLKFWYDHIFLAIILILLSLFLSRFGLLSAAFFGAIIDAGIDLIGGFGGLFTFGLATIFETGFTGIFISMLWIMMLLLAPFELPFFLQVLLKTFLLPIFLILGFFMGLIPWVGPFVTIIMAFILYTPYLNWIFCSILAVGLWLIPGFCNFLNALLQNQIVRTIFRF